MKFTFTILLIALLLYSANYPQTAKTQRYNPFSGTVVFSVEGGTSLASTDYSGLGVDYLGRLSIEYFFPAWTKSGFGIRAFGSAGFLKGSDSSLDPQEFRTNLTSIGAGVIFDLSINDVAFPYLFAGIASLSFNPKGEGGVKLPNNEAGVYKTSEVNYLGELGFRFPVTDNLSLNLSGGVQISPNDWLDDQAKGVSNDMFFTAMAGISYSFLTEFDSDGDGVVDSKDMCPDTPPGVKVDEFGCPIDSDRDGVPDYLDECPDTPFGAPVDKRGCPLDSDGDGVPDYTDLCPNTPPGVKVDAYGCPIDSDGDGVPDYLDQCPDTPYGVDVDEYGCPLDEDMDGVPDYLDQCPGTPPGVPVDERGCEIAAVPVPEVSLAAIVLSSETSFEFNSAQLKPAAFPELDKLLAEMKKYPMSRWRIEGHTDNVGSEEGNIKMSTMRAESVLNYFVSRGIPKGRFEFAGMGSKSPVADNATPEGKAKNRRVEIKRVDK
jgi:outer membrane protein OmpA-like peptidoglycan-associated protein